jgi:hypothetical protein
MFNKEHIYNIYSKGKHGMFFKTETEAFNYAEASGKSCVITKTKRGWKVSELKKHASWVNAFQANWASQVK